MFYRVYKPGWNMIAIIIQSAFFIWYLDLCGHRSNINVYVVLIFDELHHKFFDKDPWNICCYDYYQTTVKQIGVNGGQGMIGLEYSMKCFKDALLTSGWPLLPPEQHFARLFFKCNPNRHFYCTHVCFACSRMSSKVF